MGPGEITNNSTYLLRAFRHPTPQASWNYNLDATQLRALEDVGPEVLAATYYYRQYTLPNVTSPPSVLVPFHLGFYAV
jgi:hypothetical protein